MIKIITDTLSCITTDEARMLGVPLIPQTIIFGEESFQDDTEINAETFLYKLKNTKELPKTAAPAPALYSPIFEKLIEGGDTPLVICPTGQLSGTFRSAVVAAKDFPHANIRIVDTGSLGSGLGMLVKSALAWVANGLTMDHIVACIHEMASRERIYFMVATLEYLRKGGRLGNAQAIVGSVLQVKPILELKNGLIEKCGSQRTYKKALGYLKKLVKEQCPHEESALLTVMHGAEETEAQDVVDDLRRITGIPSIPLYNLPAAILVHGGPGAFGVSFFIK